MRLLAPAAALHPATLELALARLVARHSALRTTFDSASGIPYQVVHSVSVPEGASARAAARLASTAAAEWRKDEAMPDWHRAFELTVESAHSESKLQALLQSALHRPFQLASGPLLRAKVVLGGGR